MKEAYVSFEIAKLLKEKGLTIPSTNYRDWICCMYDENGNIYWGTYDANWYFRLTHQMAMKWLREVHKVFITIDAYHADHWEGYIDGFEINIYSHASTIIVPNEIAHHTDYTEAVEVALKYVLENLI